MLSINENFARIFDHRVIYSKTARFDYINSLVDIFKTICFHYTFQYSQSFWKWRFSNYFCFKSKLKLSGQRVLPGLIGRVTVERPLNVMLISSSVILARDSRSPKNNACVHLIADSRPDSVKTWLRKYHFYQLIT